MGGCLDSSNRDGVPRPSWDTREIYAKSHYFTEPVPEEMLQEIWDKFGEWAAEATDDENVGKFGPGSQVLVQFEAYGGAVTDVPPDATAFVHRDAETVCQYATYSAHNGTINDPGFLEAKDWLQGVAAITEPISSGAYINYIDSVLLQSPDWMEQYYGDNTARLLEVKNEYDPKNIFRTVGSLPATTPVSIQQESLGIAPRSHALLVGTFGEDSPVVIFASNSTGPGQIPAGLRPSWITVHDDKSKEYVYALNENFNKEEGTLTAIKMNRKTNDPKKVHVDEIMYDTSGAGPAHAALNEDGTMLAVSNYGATEDQAGLALFMLDDSGKPIDGQAPVNTLLAEVEDSELCDSEHGDIEERFGNKAHTHAAIFMGDWLYAVQLGNNRVVQLSVPDLEVLSTWEADPCSGPRHIVYNSDSDIFYVINEISAEIVPLNIDPDSGELSQTLPITTMRPEGSQPLSEGGQANGAALDISSDNRHLYASVRGANRIFVYEIAANGDLTMIQEITSHGEKPRAITLSPNGKQLQVANRGSNHIATFAVDRATGQLTFESKSETEGFSPSDVAYFELYEEELST